MTEPSSERPQTARRPPGVTRAQAQLPSWAGPALFVAAVVLPLLRQQGVRSWETIWIEDAPIYVQGANAGNALSTVFEGYAGYLQLMVRLLALPTAVLPVTWIAGYLAIASTIVCALGAAFVYRSTQGWISTWPIRLILPAVLVVGPTVAIETTATITNTIWTALAVAPWVFISVRDGRRDVVLRCVAAVVVATATALSAMFLPLAIGIAIARRTRASITVAVAFTMGLVVQGLVVLGGQADHGDNSIRLLLDFYGLRVLGNVLVGELPLDPLWTTVGEPAVVVFVLLTIGLFAVLLPGAGPRSQRMAAVMIGYSFLATAVPVWGRGTSVIGFDLGVYTWNMSRYLTAPILLLLGAVALLVDPVGAERRRRVAEVGRKVFLIQTVIILVIGFSTQTVRSEGPSWAGEIARARATACQGAPPDTVVRLTTTPSNFTVALRCDRLGT